MMSDVFRIVARPVLRNLRSTGPVASPGSVVLNNPAKSHPSRKGTGRWLRVPAMPRAVTSFMARKIHHKGTKDTKENTEQSVDLLCVFFCVLCAFVVNLPA